MSFVSGPYKWYFGPRVGDVTPELEPLGVVEDAVNFRLQKASDTIVGDNLGDTIQGVVDRGGNAYLDFVFQEWDKTAVQEMFWPWAANHGTIEIGTADVAYSKLGCVMPTYRIVAEAEPFSCATPKRFYFASVQLAPNFDLSYLLGTRHRNVSVSLLVLPWNDPSSGNGGTVPPTSDPKYSGWNYVVGDDKYKYYATGTIPA